MRKILLFFGTLILAFGLILPETANAMTAPKRLQVFEEPYFISYNNFEWLAQNKLITYKQKSYIHIRDAAQFLGLKVEVKSGDIYLTNDSSVVPTNIVDYLPKQYIAKQDDYRINPRISTHGAIVIEDEQLERPVFSKNATQKLYPASTTKIMTALIALEKGNLNDVVTVGYSATNIPSDSSKAGVRPGDRMTLEQLLYAMMLPSGNDAASAIAEYIGGTEQRFIKMMNAKARELGATNTSFTNAHGYHHDNLYTTPSDLAIIANEAIKHPAFIRIIRTPIYSTSYQNKNGRTVKKTWKNTNQSINASSPYYIPSVLGGKTGYMDKARFNLVSYARNGDYQYIVVLLRGENRQRYIDTKDLLHAAYAERTKLDRSKTSMHVVPFTNKLFINGRELLLNGEAFVKDNGTYIPVQLMKEFTSTIQNVTVSEKQEIKASLDGELLSFGQSQPVIQNDRMLVPVRTFFEHIGLQLNWNSETKKVVAFADDIFIELTINEKHVLINGQEKILDVAPIVQNNRTLLPLRFISETVGAEVDWGRGSTIYLH